MFKLKQFLPTLALLLLAALMQNGDPVAAAQYDQNYTSCSLYFQDLIVGMYDQNFDNFEKVLSFADLSNNTNFKADVVLGLYVAMSEVHHTEDPFRSIPLYNEMETLINLNNSDLNFEQEHALDTKRNVLALNIIENGSQILESGVILKNCSHGNSTVQRLYDELYFSNATLSNGTIFAMVEKVHWLLPLEELVHTLSNVSMHVSQNVDAMLALYDIADLANTIMDEFRVLLQQLTLEPSYSTTVPKATQSRVKDILNNPLQNLLGGEVCLSQQLSNGSKIFIHECGPSYRACVYIYPNAMYDQRSVFKVVEKNNGTYYNFLSKYYSYRPLNIRNGEVEQPGGFIFNVYSTSGTTTGIDWRIRLENNQAIIQNSDRTLYLCAGNLNAVVGNEWFAYTRTQANYNIHSQECKWTIDDCRVHI